MYSHNFSNPDFQKFQDMESLNKYLDQLSPNMKNKVTRHFFNLSYYEYQKVIQFVKKQKKGTQN